MFRKTAIKLAGLYLGIMAFISLCFSTSVYQLSIQELERNIRRPITIIEQPNNQNFSFSSQIRDQLLRDRQEQYVDAKNRVLNRLIIINILILVGGGVLSYYLALRTLKPIEEAHEAQARFTADASHELRTPITAMRTENEVMLMSPKVTLAQAKAQLKSNIEELEKLSDLSTGLLRLATVDKSNLETQSVTAETVITSAITKVSTLADKKKITIISNVKKNIMLQVDTTSICEVLVILLDNAIKYSPRRSEINVTAQKEGKQIVIRVADTGIGIAAQDIAYIFERFYRADSARTKQDTGGYGLGLAIAKSIVDLHGGSISVSSKNKQGTVFSVILPAKA